MDYEFWQVVLMAFLVGLFIIVFVLTVVAAILISLLDVIFRLDIGPAKLFWAGALLFIPIAGLVLYWMFRPKRFEPLLEAQEPRYTIYVGERYVSAPVQPVAELVPSRPVLVHSTPAATSQTDAGADEDETPLPRAA